jgi:hypothetical protein
MPRSESWLHLSDLGDTSGSGDDRSPSSPNQSVSDVDLRQRPVKTHQTYEKSSRMTDIPSEPSRDRSSHSSNVRAEQVTRPGMSEKEFDDEVNQAPGVRSVQSTGRIVSEVRTSHRSA